MHVYYICEDIGLFKTLSRNIFSGYSLMERTQILTRIKEKFNASNIKFISKTKDSRGLNIYSNYSNTFYERRIELLFQIKTGIMCFFILSLLNMHAYNGSNGARKQKL